MYFDVTVGRALVIAVACTSTACIETRVLVNINWVCLLSSIRKTSSIPALLPWDHAESAEFLEEIEKQSAIVLTLLWLVEILTLSEELVTRIMPTSTGLGLIYSVTASHASRCAKLTGRVPGSLGQIDM